MFLRGDSMTKDNEQERYKTLASIANTALKSKQKELRKSYITFFLS